MYICLELYIHVCEEAACGEYFLSNEIYGLRCVQSDLILVFSLKEIKYVDHLHKYIITLRNGILTLKIHPCCRGEIGQLFI